MKSFYLDRMLLKYTIEIFVTFFSVVSFLVSFCLNSLVEDLQNKVTSIWHFVVGVQISLLLTMCVCVKNK